MATSTTSKVDALERYEIVEKSIGRSRPFSITVGLKAGYNDDGYLEEVRSLTQAAAKWMEQRLAAGLPIITCTAGSEEVIYAYPIEGGAKSASEPVVNFSGNVSQEFTGHLSNDEVKAMVTELANVLGTTTSQYRVYASFDGEQWVLQQKN